MQRRNGVPSGGAEGAVCSSWKDGKEHGRDENENGTKSAGKKKRVKEKYEDINRENVGQGS